MSNATITPNEVSFVPQVAPSLEDEVQALLEKVASASPEVRKLFIARLIMGLSERVTVGVAENAVKAAQTTTKVKAPKPADLYKNPSYWPGVGLRELNDHYDPAEGWHHFGRDAYYRIIYYETQSTLEHILAHRNMPPGPPPRKNSSGGVMAKTIIQRLEKHFGNTR